MPVTNTRLSRGDDNRAEVGRNQRALGSFVFGFALSVGSLALVWGADRQIWKSSILRRSEPIEDWFGAQPLIRWYVYLAAGWFLMVLAGSVLGAILYSANRSRRSSALQLILGASIVPVLVLIATWSQYVGWWAGDDRLTWMVQPWTTSSVLVGLGLLTTSGVVAFRQDADA